KNPLLYETVVSGNIGDENLNDDNLYNVIRIPSNQIIRLKDISISDGYANGIDDSSKGSAIFCEGTLYLDNVLIKNNASLNEDVIYTRNAYVEVLDNVRLINNIKIE
ncbi:MAG: hypothetical protein AAGK97_15820, partial [Bacteroidota bacterium]